MKDTLQSKEVELEASPGKSRIRKRKSGKQKLREMRAKRKRRKSEQEREEAEAEKTDPKDSLDEYGEDTAGEKISSEVSMSTWDTLSIPTVVHESLQTMGFASPTPIQAGCIPAAINEGKDIVGAAETGSGKTLAFGIPLIYRILQHEAALASGSTSVATADPTEDESGQDGLEGEAKDEGSEQDDEEGMEDDERDGDDPSMMMTGMEANEGDDDLSDDDVDVDDDIDDSDDDVEDDDSDDDDGEQVDMQKLKTQMKCVDVVDNIADEDWLKAGLPLTSTPAGGLDQEKKLFGLVLTPTRELAVQVKNHLVAAAKKTNIKVAVVVGGMSAEKQKRVLKKRPDIIVGTPGRLWELYQLGEPHLASLPDVKCLIIDEADRMVEKGHYAELSEILDILNTSEQRSSRQTFVFSATLSLIHLGPLRKSLKKAYKQDKKDKLDSVMAKIGIKEDAEVVDLTKREGTASSLLESKIVCAVEEKDIYLFYFLRQYPGRTLVFTNSIDCIRRLASILTLLDCKPLPLHSSMHQKQRLKNLERFTGNPKGLLLATDVAARGLDIPDIEHVIHYQVPRTSESYVHRSGRTARQAKVGLSVTLVSPNEMNFYRRLCKTLNREEIPSFPVEHSYYQAVNERVELARDIDKLEHVSNKKKHQNDWFVRAAKELDVDVDEHLNLHNMGDSSEQKQFNKKLRIMRGTLKALLKRRIFAAGYSQRYLTANGKFQSPFSQATVGSHEAFSKMKARMKKDKADDSKEKDKKRKKFKRMGRYQTKK
ncbi:ATP-dependent RNA helicase DDX24 [Strongylocentrotus purpuratus]|uniref:RNA helicase n=1 Tax=Strongylocentrotus purpuratus TaxID=7668 RepID=A0A7M7NQ49_STRPU|nr:ATP-dependent RNA helicase DDX24 [Strongylocentrotus purpuratus]